MMSRRIATTALTVVMATAILTSPAQAGAFRKFKQGLRNFDFDFSSRQEPLSQGVVWTVAPSPGLGFGLPVFDNQQFDLGFGSLTLDGALIGEAAYSTRLLDVYRFSMTTLNQPLSYSFESRFGAADLFVDGNMQVQIDSQINEYGFYEQVFQISNRGTAVTEGALSPNETYDMDFDLGPIRVSGNIYLDALAAVTDPFFTAVGTENPFAAFSKGSQLTSLMTSVGDLQSRLANGEMLEGDEMAQLINNSVLASVLGAGQPDSNLFDGLLVPDGFLQQPTKSMTAPNVFGVTGAIPEPSTISLLGLGGLVLLRSRRR